MGGILQGVTTDTQSEILINIGLQEFTGAQYSPLDVMGTPTPTPTLHRHLRHRHNGDSDTDTKDDLTGLSSFWFGTGGTWQLIPNMEHGRSVDSD